MYCFWYKGCDGMKEKVILFYKGEVNFLGSDNVNYVIIL